MWKTALLVNSILIFISGGFLIYSVGDAILSLTWQRLALAIVVFIILIVIELALGLEESPRP